MRLCNTISRRRGSVTVIVVAFLALLLVLGLSFAFYALRESEESRVYRDSMNGGHTGVLPTFKSSSGIDDPPEPEAIFNSVAAQLVFGTPEDMSGYFSALRHQEMTRTIYGRNPADPLNDTQPYNGLGRVPPEFLTRTLPPNLQLPHNTINWSWLGPGRPLYDSDTDWVRDPLTNNPPYSPTNKYYARNANYTYPDENNLFLAVVDPYSGKVIVPSFHRPWLFGTPAGNDPWGLAYPNNPANATVQANWDSVNQPLGRLMLLRPRPLDQRLPTDPPGYTEFPYPQMNADGTIADVENLEGKAIGRQLDSIWIDPDLPVRTWRGKNYKPLVAFLIVDLDGRLNLNVAGNFYPDLVNPLFNVHSSNQGAGPWEMNPSRTMLNYPPPLFQAAPNVISASQLTRLPPGGATPLGHNRYGINNIPDKKYAPYDQEAIFPNIPSSISNNWWLGGAHMYGAFDLDARGPAGALQYSATATGHETGTVWGPPYGGTPQPPAPWWQVPDPPRPDPLQSRYGNGIFLPSYDERSNHPMLFNPYLVRSRRSLDLTNAPDRAFPVEEMRHLNAKFNYGDYSKSELAALAQNQLDGSNPMTAVYRAQQLNARFANTVVSNDIDIPGASPWLSAPTTYQLSGPAPAQPVGGPPVALDLTTSPGVDYDVSYRAALTSLLGPVDLNRKLADYRVRADLPYSSSNVNPASIARAAQDRQEFARDIFNRLRFVTTGQPPTVPVAGVSGDPGDPNFNAMRWLAQLAVNIVDYIDSDDVMSVFNWNPTDPKNPFAVGDFNTPAAVKQHIVFGFERPRLEMNETYIRIENQRDDPTPIDPNTGNPKPQSDPPYEMRIWIELHNPITPANAAEQNSSPDGDDGQSGGYRAKLTDNFGPGGEQSIYRILIQKVNRQPAPQNPADPMKMRAMDDVTGTPDTTQQTIKTVDFASANVSSPKGNPQGKVVHPNDLSKVNNGYGPDNTTPTPSFYLIGPDDDATQSGNPAQLPGTTTNANLTTKDLQIGLADMTDVSLTNGTLTPLWVPGFVLQRLANPYAPPDPVFNPYIGTDYLNPDMSAVSIYDRAKAVVDASRKQQPDLQTTYAWGRRQPYDAVIDYTQPGRYRQTSAAPVPGQIGGQTMGRHNGAGNSWPTDSNGTLETPFRPLIHLDRFLISTTELLNVVSVRPFELTQLYAAPPLGQRWQYMANWLDNNVQQPKPGTYLYRALEVLKVPTRLDGLGMGGRVPGKVNINTVFAKEVFDAICDVQSGNRFTQTDVDAAWNKLILDPVTGRTPQFAGKQISSNDRPLYGLATAVAPGASYNNNFPTDRNRTIIQPNTLWAESGQASQEDYQPDPKTWAGPVRKYELLNKVMNNFTTRSNSFAVYATIGYFEVRNSGPYNETNRPILGKELGTDDGTVVRHKFFSIIDRTNLTIEPPSAPPGPTAQPIRQGQPPIYFSFEPNVQQPRPGNPPSGNNYTVIPDPYTLGQPFVEVRIPAQGLDASGALYGSYDGVPWNIRPGSVIVLDAGDRQEVVVVQYPQAPGVPFNPAAQAGVIDLYPYPYPPNPAPVLQKSHTRGAVMRLVNPDPTLPGMIPLLGVATNLVPASTPGNPGPQPGFNYKSPRYASVVKYVEQLK